MLTKVFIKIAPEKLEPLLNEWLAEKPPKKVVAVSQSVNSDLITLVVFYEEVLL